MSRPTNSGDSAGQPWGGRHFESNAHSGDDGSMSPELGDALAAFRAGEAGPELVVDVFRRSRLLIPLVAHAGEEGVTEDGLVVDKTQELSIVTVTAPDGRRVLPVFSSVTAMSAWRSDARPVPADGVRVALAAAGDNTDLVVLDPTSETEFGLRRPAVWSVAQEQPWVPSWRNPAVSDAFAASISTELAVVAVVLDAADPGCRLDGPELTVRLELVAGLNRTELDAVLARLAARWAADDVIATQVDSLAVQLTAVPDA